MLHAQAQQSRRTSRDQKGAVQKLCALVHRSEACALNAQPDSWMPQHMGSGMHTKGMIKSRSWRRVIVQVMKAGHVGWS